jgi:hypothetical protein
MAQMGRIGGPLLADNLLRNGNDLAFESSQLYLSVGSKRLGINSVAPTSELSIGTILNSGAAGTGTGRSTNYISNTLTDIANFVISGSTIQNMVGAITITPASNGTTNTPGFSTSNLYVTGNTILDTVTNDSINFAATGTGQIKLNNDTLVSGNLHATGNITFDGNIQLGSSSADTITFAAEVNSDIIPSSTTSYDLGSTALQWNQLYANNIISGSLSTMTVSNLTLTQFTGGNVNVNGNTISDSVTDLSITPNGTGVVQLGGNTGTITITGNNIVNNLASAISIASTNNGYTKFTGSSGIVIGVGTDAQRPVLPEVGTTRYNTDRSYVEVWNGSAWTGPQGVSPTLTPAQVNDVVYDWALILG